MGPNHSFKYVARSVALNLTINGVLIVAFGNAGCSTACVSSASTPSERAASSLRNTPSFCTAPSTSTVRDERHDVRIETGFGQHVASNLDGDRQWQNRAGMRLHHNRIAGCEAGKKSGVAIPRRKRTAADDQRNAARHDAKAFFHLERLV